MNELNRKAVNRQEMMNRAVNEFMNLTGQKNFFAAKKTNSEKHECVLEVLREIGKVFDTKISVPDNWDKELLSLAENSGLVCREVVLHPDWQKKDCGVLAAFWQRDNFPVALFPGKNGYKMFDPQEKQWRKVTAEVAEKFGMRAFCFYELLPDKKITPKDLFLFSKKQLSAYDFISLAVAALAVAVISLFFPIITGFLLDEIIPLSQQSSMITTGLFLAAFLPAQFLFQFMQMFIQVRVETKMHSSLQTAVWYRVMHYKTTFFRKFSAGDLAGRIADVGEIQRNLQENLTLAIFSCLAMIINLSLMFFYNAEFALSILLITAVWFAFTIPLNKLLLKLQRDISLQSGKLSGFLLQLMKGVPKVQAAAAECTIFSQWAAIFAPLSGNEQKQYLSAAKVKRSYSLMQCFVIAFVYFFAAKKSGMFSIGKFAAFTSALSVFLAAVWKTYQGIIKCMNAAVKYKRLEPIFSEQPETSGVNAPPGDLSGAIDIQHVTFRYSQGSSAILKDISMNIKPGEFVAFVGSSGCGKSTLMRLLLGFEIPESGSIKFDGQDLATLDCKMVRRQFGVVLQSGKLLSADIYRNIAGAAADLPMEEAWAAAEMAGIADDIREMPMGMFTQISDCGGNLSGGQRQRILIARAIARKPKILLFDEATSALDNKTQALVSQSIEKLKATRIAIAHRLSTIKNVDRIFVFSKGGIEEVGTYDELMSARGAFYNLAKRQMI